MKLSALRSKSSSLFACILSLSFLFCIPSKSNAQGGFNIMDVMNKHNSYNAFSGRYGDINSPASKREYIGFGKQFMSPLLNVEYYYADKTPLNNHTKTSSILAHTTSQSYAFHLGTYFPLGEISNKSILAIGAQITVLYTTITFDPLKFYGRETLTDNYPLIAAMLPVSFEYKYGSEATMLKQDHFMLTLGAGVAPGAYTVYRGEANVLPRVLPFVKAEVGFMTGIAWKLQFNAYLGRMKLLDVSYTTVTEDAGNNKISDGMSIKSNSGYGYNVSLCILPLSFMWEKD